MLFTSPEFLVFFALVLAVYWPLRARFRVQNGLLLVASWIFYGWVEPWFVTLLLASTLLDWSCALGIAKWPRWRNRLLVATLCGNLGMLGVFKYWNFFIDNAREIGAKLGLDLPLPLLEVVLPVGISFYTFQTMSYTIDVWRGQLAPRRNLLDFALFVAFFPQLVAGPIERAGALLPQIEQPRRLGRERFLSAWPLLLTGFWKKLVFADTIAGPVDRIFMRADPSLPLLAAGALLFSLQIFADFSGYSDMARGIAKLLGFELRVNFEAPFLARTLPEFWRRWHVSLSFWIRDYVFIPLGGSRGKTSAALLVTLLVTMGLSGLWHGAAWTFVIWGLGHGFFTWLSRMLGLESKWQPRRAWHGLVSWAATFAIVVALFAVFRARSMEWLFDAVARGCGAGDPAQRALDGAAAGAALLTGAAYAAPWLGHFLLERAGPRAQGSLAAWRFAMFGALVGLLVQLLRQQGRAFIYFQF